MKLNYAIYSMLALSMVATSCSQDEELASSQPSAKSNIAISVTDIGMKNADGTRATTDASYATTFAEGDAIGLYAVSDGKIVDGCNNLKLTKSGSSWTGLTEGSSFAEGTKFYAYYPYSESASYDVTNGFDTMISSWDPTSASSYDAGDLMTTSEGATMKVGDDKLSYSLSLQLAHKMSMIEITNKAGSSITYNFTNTDVTLDAYTVTAGSSEISSISIGSTTYSNTEEVGGKTRILVNPSKTDALSIVVGGTTYSSEALSLTGGNYYTVSVGESSGSSTVQWELAVGDYMCKDGTLLKSTDDNFATKKENIIGVVCYVGDPSPSQKYPASYGSNAETDKTSLDGIYQGGYSHGLVYSITGDKMTNAWGTTECTTLYDAFAAVTTALTESSNSNISKRALLGHANMETLRAINSSNSSYFDNIIKAIDGFSVSAPSKTSGWFLPSYGDVKAIIDGSVTDGKKVSVTFDGTTISNAFSALNVTLWDTDVVYMTSSPGITSSKTNTEKFYGVKNSSISTYAVDGTQESALRPFLAF